MSFRIVSLCPSTTLTLFDLGLGDSIVGRTRYCENPSGAIPAVGGTKDPNWDAIESLAPTHILFNLEENDHTQRSIAEDICETVVHTPVTIEESKQFVLDLGEVFEASDKAEAIAAEIDTALEALRAVAHPFSYLYFIWHHPRQRVANNGTYIAAMLKAAGGFNLAADFSEERYPLMPNSFEGKADLALLSTEPYPFKEKHIKEYQQFGYEAQLIDGEQVCWHGSKTANGLKYLTDFITKRAHA
ncbi:MAG: helical backbone metal receptor [Coraliomargarita sp.]